MIGARIRLDLRFRRVRQAARKASPKPLSQAAGAIRKTAQRSIKRRGKRGGPAAPGRPPKTLRGRLKRSILYSVDRQRMVAVIGPAASIIGRQVARTHEFGGRERRRASPFRLRIGGHGPIDRRVRKGKFGLVVAKLHTSAQVDRAARIAADYERWLATKPKARFPARPFMAPALEANRPTLPRAWSAAIKTA